MDCSLGVGIYGCMPPFTAASDGLEHGALEAPAALRHCVEYSKVGSTHLALASVPEPVVSDDIWCVDCRPTASSRSTVE